MVQYLAAIDDGRMRPGAPLEIINETPARIIALTASLSPEDGYGHDLLFWLDRMVRTNQPFVERMALIWHDWFATSHAGVDSQKLMIEQYELFRRVGRGSFEELLRRSSAEILAAYPHFYVAPFRLLEQDAADTSAKLPVDGEL